MDKVWSDDSRVRFKRLHGMFHMEQFAEFGPESLSGSGFPLQQNRHRPKVGKGDSCGSALD